MNPKSPRILFFAALGLYILWFGALVGLAIVSADRPSEGQAPARPAFVRGLKRRITEPKRGSGTECGEPAVADDVSLQREP